MRTLASVAVPCALTSPPAQELTHHRGARHAIARAAPSAEGWVTWQASADMPKPTLSQRLAAGQRALQRLQPHGVPSPKIIPERFAEKGRQVSGLTTRIASHASQSAQEKWRFTPPGNGHGGAAPERTIRVRRLWHEPMRNRRLKRYTRARAGESSWRCGSHRRCSFPAGWSADGHDACHGGRVPNNRFRR